MQKMAEDEVVACFAMLLCVAHSETVIIQPLGRNSIFSVLNTVKMSFTVGKSVAFIYSLASLARQFFSFLEPLRLRPIKFFHYVCS